MRWFLVLLIAPLLLLAGLVGQPISVTPVHVAAPPAAVRVALPPTPLATPVPTVAAVASGSVLEQLLAIARSWLSPPVPYRWGGCSRAGIDCSCFVQTVYAAVGIRVPRTTVTQIAFDRPVGRSELRPGDTLFFDDTCDHSQCGANPTHEGLYIGADLMIEAGDPVQIASIDAPYWRAHYHSAGRPPAV